MTGTWGTVAAGPSSAVADASGGIAPVRESVAMAIEADALQAIQAGDVRRVVVSLGPDEPAWSVAEAAE